ncbi:MAG TPA: hypothetical protein VGB15_11920 [Longimicrobium sp.]
MNSALRTLLLATAAVAAACTPDSAARDPLTPTHPRMVVTSGTVTCPDTISVGQTAQCVAYFYDHNNNLIASATPTWSTTTGTLVSVNGSGQATGLAVGSATVQASYGGVTGNKNVYVKPGLTVTISPPSTVRRFTSCTWYKSVSGGTAPYTYYWEIDGGSGTSTSATFTADVISASADIYLTVTDANGVQKTVTKHINTSTSAPLCGP